MDEYVVLRTSALPRTSGADPFGGALETAGASEVMIETATLTEKQADAEARDPRNVVAPNVPVSLIAPVAAADFSGAEMLVEADAVATAIAKRRSWGVADVKAPSSTVTGRGVKVAVLDTGIDRDHAAFQDGLSIVGKNFTGAADNDFADRQGHGTHCAGTIFGRDVEGVRIGVAPGVSDVLIGKVLDDSGRGSSAMVLDALQWAAQLGANVVSMSLGFDFPAMQERLENEGRPKKLATSMALRAYRENLRLFDSLLQFLMLDTPRSKGMVVVAASGNESRRHQDPTFIIDVSLPAAATAIVSVGAYGRNGQGVVVAPFSNINPVLCGPGVDIVSAKRGGGLSGLSGTSMACPHVAGVAALWWEESANQGFANGAVVRAKLLASAAMANPRLPLPPVDVGSGRPLAPQ